MTEKDIKASALYLNRHQDSPKQIVILAGSVHKMERDHLKIKTVGALFVVMPTHYLYEEVCDLKQINLRCNQQGSQHEKQKQNKGNENRTTF